MKEYEELKTTKDFLRYGLSQANQADIFYGHGTDNAWDEIYSLVLRSLHLPYDCLPYLLDGRLTAEEKKHLQQQLHKRLVEHVPVPYLIQEAYFCNLPFYVDERVLIPRSPMAELIENHFAPWVEYEKVGRILDMCTGSACIAIACCDAFPDTLVDAVDISEEALAVAEINRERYELEEQLQLLHSDCFTSVPKQQYDIIISNPPYVGAEEMQTLPAEFNHEPVLALQTDNNGLAIVEKILAQAHAYLSEHGILVVEVGNSEEALIEAYPDLPFTWLDFERGGQGVFLLTAKELRKHYKGK